MPKGKHRRKRENINSGSLLLTKMEGSDEDSFNDNASIVSTVSGSTLYEEMNLGDEIVENNQQNEIFEDKLSEAIEGMLEKSVQSRINSFETVTAALMKRFVPDFVNRRRMTISDAIERSLRKGRGNEQAAAAQLAVLLCIQLGSSNAVDKICRTLIPSLLLVVRNISMSYVARAKCCWASSILTFIGNYGDIDGVTDALRQTFSASSFMKHSSLNSNQNAEETFLCTAALSAWCLLLTVSPSTDSFILYLNQMAELLDSNSVEIRMSVGEIIVVILEQLREFDDSEMWEPDENLILKLRELATDSHKFRAKKDRKTQRSVFRDIIRYIEEGEFPKMQVHFGLECLSLDSWCRKKQYDALLEALGSGMNLHLQENSLLREILDLGEKINTLPLQQHKQIKAGRHALNAAASKARSINRAKLRDKRSISMSYLS